MRMAEKHCEWRCKSVAMSSVGGGGQDGYWNMYDNVSGVFITWLPFYVTVKVKRLLFFSFSFPASSFFLFFFFFFFFFFTQGSAKLPQNRSTPVLWSGHLAGHSADFNSVLDCWRPGIRRLPTEHPRQCYPQSAHSRNCGEHVCIFAWWARSSMKLKLRNTSGSLCVCVFMVTDWDCSSVKGSSQKFAEAQWNEQN